MRVTVFERMPVRMKGELFSSRGSSLNEGNSNYYQAVYVDVFNAYLCTLAVDAGSGLGMLS